MALANAHYYATRDPLGVAGDFTTAPEISQMFGELVGLALADVWQRAGSPPARYVELGPGRGTLAADALRAMAAAGLRPPVDLVETSPVLRAAQAARVPSAAWRDAVESLPGDGALLIVANEFFDALPVRQRDAAGTERMVRWTGERFVADPMADIREDCPAAAAIMAALAARLCAQGGVLIAIDYGYRGPAAGETLQAVRRHAAADPFADPGEQDLTAHVDFTALAQAAGGAGATVHGPVAQGQWLTALGLSQRAAALARAAPARAEEIAGQYRRLTDAAEMGALFKVLGITAPGWPAPAGL